jgi:hypothetical protein
MGEIHKKHWSRILMEKEHVGDLGIDRRRTKYL